MIAVPTEDDVKVDMDRHHRGMEAAADAGTLQRQYDEPVHGQSRAGPVGAASRFEATHPMKI